MFNKKLSQLEAMYQVAPPVKRSEDPIHVADFIHHVFENQKEYDLEGLEKDWFVHYATNYPERSFRMINGLLETNGHMVSKKSILEGIDTFRKNG